ncbi:hypothetical protein ACMYYO_14170 [Dermacoccaceae bacterium W4C1]
MSEQLQVVALLAVIAAVAVACALGARRAYRSVEQTVASAVAAVEGQTREQLQAQDQRASRRASRIVLAVLALSVVLALVAVYVIAEVQEPTAGSTGLGLVLLMALNPAGVLGVLTLVALAYGIHRLVLAWWRLRSMTAAARASGPDAQAALQELSDPASGSGVAPALLGAGAAVLCLVLGSTVVGLVLLLAGSAVAIARDPKGL